MLSLMQRFFSMFPHGAPGIALLLLRISVAAIFFMNAVNRLDVSSVPLLFAVVLLISISMAVGFLTPILSVIAAVSAVANLLMGPHQDHIGYIFHILDAAALTLLGPGAYSVDARFFGRRVIVVLPRKDRKQD